MDQSNAMAAAVRTGEVEGCRIFYLAGELELPRIDAFRAALIEGLLAGPPAVLDLSGVESIDLSGLQLVCSAYRTCVRLGGGFTLRGVREEIRSAAHAAGFRTSNPGAEALDAAGCIWGD